MSENSLPNFYAIIPATVRYCKELEPSAKLLYGEISALTSKEGYCWASNSYFADLYDVDERTIKRWIASLEALGFIRNETVNIGFQKKRKTYLNSPENKNILTKGQKCPDRKGQKCPLDGDKNVPYSITSNTTSDDDDKQPKLSDEIGSLKYIKSNGTIQSVSIEEIFKHFLKSGYPVETIKEAIQRVRDKPDCINNIMKYLDSVCSGIEKDKKRKITQPHKKNATKQKTGDFGPVEDKPLASELLANVGSSLAEFWNQNELNIDKFIEKKQKEQEKKNV